jgi:hypothetical protein
MHNVNLSLMEIQLSGLECQDLSIHSQNSKWFVGTLVPHYSSERTKRLRLYSELRILNRPIWVAEMKIATEQSREPEHAIRRLEMEAVLVRARLRQVVTRQNQYCTIAFNSYRSETDMNADPTTGSGDRNAHNDFRQLFFAHVGTVVLTAALVLPLLLGVASIPSWLSVAYCIVIAIVAFTFVIAAINSIRDNRGIRVAHRIECLALTLALSMLQVIFVLPVIICIFAPTFRF